MQLSHQPPPPPSLALGSLCLKPDSELSLPSSLEDSWSTRTQLAPLLPASHRLSGALPADRLQASTTYLRSHCLVQASGLDICLPPPCSPGAQQGQSGLLSDWQRPASPHPPSLPQLPELSGLGHITGTHLVTEDRNGTRGKEKDSKIEIEIQHGLCFLNMFLLIYREERGEIEREEHR